MVSLTAIIPCVIWQTYRTAEPPQRVQEWTGTWRMYNPNCSYTLMDDAAIDRYVQTWDKTTYAFCALPLGVMKADFWRYLIVADRGGVYADSDTSVWRGLHQWTLPAVGKNHTLVITYDGYPAFCQWLFAATPDHPALMHVVSYIVSRWLNHGIGMKGTDAVHHTTGAAIWADALMDYMGLKMGILDFRRQYDYNAPFRGRVHDHGIVMMNLNAHHQHHYTGTHGGGWRGQLRQHN